MEKKAAYAQSPVHFVAFFSTVLTRSTF